MVNRTSRHLDFLVDHLHIVHAVCIFVDFGYCMDPLALTCMVAAPNIKICFETFHRIKNFN